MSVEAVRALERAHGAISWVAAAALVVTAWLAVRGRTRRGGVLASGGAALVILIAAAATGLALDAPYRSRLRQRLFLRSMRLGWLFERKEHLAFAALLFAVAAAASLGALALAERSADDPLLARDLRRSAALGWAGAAVFGVAASVASAVVARYARF